MSHRAAVSGSVRSKRGYLADVELAKIGSFEAALLATSTVITLR